MMMIVIMILFSSTYKCDNPNNILTNSYLGGRVLGRALGRDAGSFRRSLMQQGFGTDGHTDHDKNFNICLYNTVFRKRI